MIVEDLATVQSQVVDLKVPCQARGCEHEQSKTAIQRHMAQLCLVTGHECELDVVCECSVPHENNLNFLHYHVVNSEPVNV